MNISMSPLSRMVTSFAIAGSVLTGCGGGENSEAPMSPCPPGTLTSETPVTGSTFISVHYTVGSNATSTPFSIYLGSKPEKCPAPSERPTDEEGFVDIFTVSGALWTIDDYPASPRKPRDTVWINLVYTDNIDNCVAALVVGQCFAADWQNIKK